MALAEGYNDIKERLAVQAENSLGDGGLSEVKNDFMDTVNSNRRLSVINNFRSLLEVLEKRGIIGERSITALFRISDRINNADLRRRMVMYADSLPVDYQYAGPARNQYELALRRDSSSYSEHPSTPGSSYFGHSQYSISRSDDVIKLPEGVIEIICTNIGKSWMDLARKLKVREADIDDIDQRYAFTSKEKARDVLKIFEKGMDSQKWQFILLEGLNKARRQDIKEDVEEWLSRRR